MITPLQNYVLIQLAPLQAETDSGFILAAPVEKVRNTGIVVSVAESGLLPSKQSFTIGDNVMFLTSKAVIVDEDHRLVDGFDIIAKL